MTDSTPNVEPKPELLADDVILAALSRVNGIQLDKMDAGWFVLDTNKADYDTGYLGEYIAGPVGYEEAKRLWNEAQASEIRSLLDTRPTPAAVGGEIRAVLAAVHANRGHVKSTEYGRGWHEALDEIEAEAALAQPQPSGGVDEARALLAAEYREFGLPDVSEGILRDGPHGPHERAALRAITAALSAQPSGEVREAAYWRGRCEGLIEALRKTHTPEQMVEMGFV